MVKTTYRTIQDYVQGCDEEYRARIQDILSICRELVPDAEEKISWGLPTFLYHGYLVQVGQCKGYIGFYPGNDAIREFQEELASYKCTKTAIHLPLHEKLPLALIRRILIFCKEYNEAHD